LYLYHKVTNAHLGIYTVEQMKQAHQAEALERLGKAKETNNKNTPETCGSSGNDGIKHAEKNEEPTVEGTPGKKARSENNNQKSRTKAKKPTSSALPGMVDISQIPTLVSLEVSTRNACQSFALNFHSFICTPIKICFCQVLSNGTTHLGPSMVIRTPFRSYIFNCPEASGRFYSALRVRATSTNDFFFTRGNHFPICALKIL
jgi:hypothetical protein